MYKNDSQLKTEIVELLKGITFLFNIFQNITRLTI